MHPKTDAGLEQAKHTPTPWKTEVLGHCVRVTKSEHDNDNDDIAVLGDCLDPQQRANAEFICRAVNSHESLLSACKHVLKFEAQSLGSIGLAMLRNAVAAAEGGQS